MIIKNIITLVLIFSILIFNSCAHTYATKLNKNDAQIGDVVIIQLKDENIIKMKIKEITDEALISEKYTVNKADIISIEKEKGNLFLFSGIVVGAIAIAALVLFSYGISQIGTGGK